MIPCISVPFDPADPDDPEDAAGDGPLLEVSGLGFAYGSRMALADVDLTLWPGEVLAVAGESGSGKTTLLGCLSGELVPQAGRVGFLTRAGKRVDMHSLGEAERRRLLSAPFTEERELRRALRGIELRSNALRDTFHRRHPAGEDSHGN